MLTPGLPAQSREIFDVEISQTLLHEPERVALRSQHQTQIRATLAPTNFSPIALSVRGDADQRAQRHAARRVRQPATTSCGRISAQGQLFVDQPLQVNGGWSKRAFIAETRGFNDPSPARSLRSTARARVHTMDNRFGAHLLVQLRRAAFEADAAAAISAFYNAQCCGLALEYQTYNYGPKLAARRFRPTTASSCRSRSPASATSRRSTAR